MGRKKFYHQGSMESGCMWGIITHHFHHKKWHQIIKREKQQPSDARIPSKASGKQETADPVIPAAEEAKSSSPKSSMRSRLKALIAQKMPKRKSGRQSRSSSCPVETQKDDETVHNHCPQQSSDNTMSMLLPPSESTSMHKAGTQDLHHMYSPDRGNRSPEEMNRSPTYDESVQRYNQILQTCSNNLNTRETKEYGISRGLTLSPVPLRRTRSLPDLRSYFQTLINDDDCCLNTTDHTNDVRDMSIAVSNESLVISSDDTSQPLKPNEGSENGFNCEKNGTQQCPGDKDATSSGSLAESTINADEAVEIEANQRSDDDSNKPPEFNYVKNVPLEGQSSLISNDRIIRRPEIEESSEISCSDHHLLFDLVNEVLLSVGDRRSIRRRHAAVVQRRNMEEVWAEIRRLVGCRAEAAANGGDVMRWDLEKWDRWMEEQLDEESVAVELEQLILDDLLKEIICN